MSHYHTKASVSSLSERTLSEHFDGVLVLSFFGTMKFDAIFSNGCGEFMESNISHTCCTCYAEPNCEEVGLKRKRSKGAGYIIGWCIVFCPWAPGTCIDSRLSQEHRVLSP